MLKIENTDVYGWEAAIRGMRNPMNSWDKSDSEFNRIPYTDVETGNVHANTVVEIGHNDLALMMRLANAGSTHAKYRRMITVTCDITAPLYWWKEFDTYKVGTVANSCSTMHKVHAKEFTRDDFSHERLSRAGLAVLEIVITELNEQRNAFLSTKDMEHWHNMIQLLPSSYNQRRTVQMNYEVLVGIYRDRKNHKLAEWHTLCDWIKSLPYSELIILE